MFSMNDYGLVSIITPTYNCWRFIAETIESVLAQTYPNWELIIVDDCSTDKTKDVVEKFKDSRIKYFRLGHNSGAAIARNTALSLASGQWIAFLDSDDLWLPEKLERQLNFMVTNDYDFTYTNYSECDEASKLQNVCISGPMHISKVGMFAFCWPGCLTVMYNHKKIGLIQIEDIKKNNDYAMWLKVCKRAKCHLLPENLATYRRGRAASISNHSFIKLIKWHYRLFSDAEQMNPISSTLLTCLNLGCGFFKKLRYVKHI